MKILKKGYFLGDPEESKEAYIGITEISWQGGKFLLLIKSQHSPPFQNPGG